MATRLIELSDGTLVEAQVSSDEAEPISGGFAKRVDGTFERIKPLLLKTCKPIAEAWRELSEDLSIEQAEVEIGLGFEGEGNIYVTKATASANLTVTLTIKPKAN